MRGHCVVGFADTTATCRPGPGEADSWMLAVLDRPRAAAGCCGLLRGEFCLVREVKAESCPSALAAARFAALWWGGGEQRAD